MMTHPGEEAVEQTTTYFTELGLQLRKFFPTLLIALGVFCIGVLIAHLLTKLIGRTLRPAKIDDTAKSFSQSLVRILIICISAFIALNILGVPSASILAVLGTMGITAGFALQNSLSNISGGFLLMFAKSFQAGDYIIVGSSEGYVESLTILHTKLRTIDSRTVCLPNSLVSSQPVVNLTRKGMLRVRVSVTVSYDTDLQAAREALLQAAGEIDMVQKKPAPFADVAELGDHGVRFNLYAWVKPANFLKAPPRLLEHSKIALDKAGISIPFPQLDLHCGKELTDRQEGHDHADSARGR